MMDESNLAIESERDNSLRGPKVQIPPPIIFIAFFALGVLLQTLFPFSFPIQLALISRTLMALSLIVALLGFWRFYHTHTTIRTEKESSAFITNGIFSISRNPLYLSLLLLYCGVGLYYQFWWTLILSPFLVLAMNYLVISKEEAYLLRRFGRAYQDYYCRVRRWL
jgi:protein-S-isoprenylcysteine O-methyltransferase Ste14